MEGGFLAFNSNCSPIASTVEMSGIHLGISEASFIVSLVHTSINQGYSDLSGPRKDGRGGEKLKNAFSFLSDSVSDSSI